MKQKLELKPTEIEGLKVGTQIDGRQYTVRDDRHRYFFPGEWNTFIKHIRTEKQAIFDLLINTGARINEALQVRPMDFDWERNNLTLIGKKKAAKKERTGKRRTFTISSQFSRRMRKHIRENNIQDDQRITKVTQKAVYLMLKRGLESAGLNPWEFSLHNIRKTHGNWLKALMRFSNGMITESEICLRLGHDMNTFIKHYGSASIFDQRDINLMIKILGDVYGLR